MSNGLLLGPGFSPNVHVTPGVNSFLAKGHHSTVSPPIPLRLILYPPELFSLVRALAVQSGEDVTTFDGVVKLADYTYSKTTDANGNSSPKRAWNQLNARDKNIFTGFNLPNFVDKAFSVASANLEITTEAQVGVFLAPITFSQLNVPLKTDDSLHLLLPVLSKPVVQKIIDGSILSIDRVTILNPAQKKFQTHLVGEINYSGPLMLRFNSPRPAALLEWKDVGPDCHASDQSCCR